MTKLPTVTKPEAALKMLRTGWSHAFKSDKSWLAICAKFLSNSEPEGKIVAQEKHGAEVLMDNDDHPAVTSDINACQDWIPTHVTFATSMFASCHVCHLVSCLSFAPPSIPKDSRPGRPCRAATEQTR